MKVLQLAALFGATAYAVNPLVGRDDATTTVVVYTTSTRTITECAASVAHCPSISATEMVTSTTVMSVTTAVCPATSTPGPQLPQSDRVHSPFISSAALASSPGTTNTLSDSVPTSYPSGASGPSSVHLPPVRSSALPTASSRPVDFSVSVISPKPSLPVTSTGSVPSSSAPAVPEFSSTSALLRTSTLPTGPLGSDTIVVPRPSPSGSASFPASLTDSVSTSFPPGISASGSSNSYTPSQQSTNASSLPSLPIIGTATFAVPTSGITLSNTRPSAPLTATDTVSSFEHLASSPGRSSDAPSASMSRSANTATTSRYAGSSVVPAGSNSHSGPRFTATDADHTYESPGPSTSPPSGASWTSSTSNTATGSVPLSGYPISSAYDSVVPSGPVGTNTDRIPTSLSSSASDRSSSSFTIPGTTALPTQGNPSPSEGHSSGSVPVVPSGILATISSTSPATTSASSGFVYPGISSPASTAGIDGTTAITSGLTSTSATYITVPLPSGSSLTITATDAIPTSRGTGSMPSGSGYSYPSGGANGTIIAPSPSYIEVPVNMGQTVTVGQSPIAAIVIALAFTLFA